jgi:YfiH family protein
LADTREVIRAQALAGVPHGFLTAVGPAGEPDPNLIVPGGKLVLLEQVHSPLAIAVQAPCDERPPADASATGTPGLVLGIVTADCAPVLADRRAGVIGAAHAGWRGAHGGILEAVVEEMEALGAHREDIAAAIGPAIALESYEVDDAFRARFTQSDGRFFAPASRAGHWLFDLEGYVEARLDAMGVGVVECLGLDTYAGEGRFHSYRRATHRGEPTYGRQYSLIGLPE